MESYRSFLSSRVEAPQILYDPSISCISNEGQCDCACGVDLQERYENTLPLTSSSYKLSLSKPFSMIHVSEGFYAVRGQNIPFIILNDAAWVIAQHFRSPRPLYAISETWNRMWGKQYLQSTLQHLQMIGLLRPEGCSSPIISKTHSQLSAWLHLTARCNLRCAYCYLSHTQADMTIETGRAVVDAIVRSARRHHYRRIKLKYAGGEPLLCLETLRNLHEYARMQAEREELNVDEVVLSNGTLLTAKIIAILQTLNMRLMISLDGIGSQHNGQRYFVDHSPSFDRVANAVELALRMGLTPEISVTVSGRNSTGLPELFAWLLDHDLPFSVNFYRENGCSATETDLKLEDERMIRGMLAAYKILEARLPGRSLLNTLVDRGVLSAAHVRPCSVGQDYLVFAPDGRIAKCQMDLAATITDYSDPDPLTRIRQSPQGIQNVSVDDKVECAHCQWRYWCAGGCPLLAYRTSGRYDRKSPHCHIYQALYPEVIRLEGLRVLSQTHYSITTLLNSQNIVKKSCQAEIPLKKSAK